jgi:diguanylate cyclase
MINSQLRGSNFAHGDLTKGKWRVKVISLKKYLDMPGGEVSTSGPESSCAAAVDCYRAMLLATGKDAALACSTVGETLDVELRKLANKIGPDVTAELLMQTEADAEARLEDWRHRTAQHLKSKADDAKELLLVLAKTAEAVGSRDEGHARQLHDLTLRLEKICDLDDLSEIRVSLTKHVTELKDNVTQMKRDNQELVDQMRHKLTTYENKLKEVQLLVLKDELTGLANRRSVEERIQLNIANGIEFCVLLLDLNGFKAVNDKYGHPAGDDLLKQFATELLNRSRVTDLVGRWGGDEFIVIYEKEVSDASLYVRRIEEWVFGRYQVRYPGDPKPHPIEVTAAIGVAKWMPGETMEHVVACADAAMYENKRAMRALRSAPS